MVQKSILKDKPEILIRQYYQVLRQHKISVDKLIMFGSYARGRQKPWSDLDLCVVSKSFGKNNYDETVRLKKLTTAVDTMIEPHPYHPDDLNNKWDPLAMEIKKYGRLVI